MRPFLVTMNDAHCGHGCVERFDFAEALEDHVVRLMTIDREFIKADNQINLENILRDKGQYLRQ